MPIISAEQFQTQQATPTPSTPDAPSGNTMSAKAFAKQQGLKMPPPTGMNIVKDVAQVADMVLGIPAFAAKVGAKGVADIGYALAGEKEPIKKSSELIDTAMETPWMKFLSAPIQTITGMSTKGTAVGEFNEKLGSFMDKAAEYVGKKTGSAELGQATKQFADIAMLGGADIAGKGFRAWRDRKTASGNPPAGTEEEILKKYAEDTGNPEGHTAEDIRSHSDTQINAERRAYDLIQQGASLKKTTAAIKRDPLVGEAIDKFMKRREEIQKGPMAETLQGEVLPPEAEGVKEPVTPTEGVPAIATGTTPDVQIRNIPDLSAPTVAEVPALTAPVEPGILKDQSGKADPKLLAAMGLTIGGAMLGYALAPQEQLEGAIAGGIAGAVAMSLPHYVDALKDNWKKTLTTTATIAGVTGTLAAINSDHPAEAVLLGMIWGGTKALPKAVIPKIGNMTIDELTQLATGSVAANNRETANVSRAIKSVVPDEARRNWMAEKMERGDLSGFSKNELLAAKAFRGFMDSYKDAAKDAGIFSEFVQNYVTHIIEKEGLPQTKVQETLDALFGTQGRVGGIVTKTPFADPRKYRTFDELQAALKGSGLQIKTRDIAEIADIYGKSMGRAIANKTLVTSIQKAKGVEKDLGSALVIPSDKAPLSYQIVDSPHLRGMMVHPDIAPALKFAMEAKTPNDIVRGLVSVSMAQKRLSVAGTFFHASNLALAFVGAEGLRGIKDLALAAGNLTPFQALHGKSNLDAVRKVWENGGAGDVFDYGVRGGLKVDPISDVDVNALAKIGGVTDMLVNRALGTDMHLAEKGLGAVEKIQKSVFDKVTWDYLHTNIKLAVFSRNFEKGLRDHPELPKEEVARQVAAATNDFTGGLDWGRVAAESQSAAGRRLAMSALSPQGRMYLQLAMFAPDWTLSSFRALYKALPGGADKPVNKHMHQMYALRTAVMWGVVLNGYNMAVNDGKFIWENKDPFRIQYKDGDSQQVDKHAFEFSEWLRNPRQTALNKMGYVPKEVANQLMRTEYLAPSGGKGKAMVFGPAMRGSPLQHALSGVTPMAAQSLRNAPDVVTGAKRAAQEMLGAKIYPARKKP